MLDDTRVTSISTTAFKIIFNDNKYLITLHKLDPKNSNNSSQDCQNTHNSLIKESYKIDEIIASNEINLKNHNIKSNMETET